MISSDHAFLLELMMSPEERVFYQALYKDPSDQAARNAYADWLMEQGRHLSAEQVKLGHGPPNCYYRVKSIGNIEDTPVSHMTRSGYDPSTVIGREIVERLNRGPRPSNLLRSGGSVISSGGLSVSQLPSFQEDNNG